VGWFDRLGAWGLALLPGVLVVYLGFNAGGYFPGTPALVAVVLLLVLVARILAAERPFAGFSLPLGACAGALALYAIWSLFSTNWSDSTWRGLVEFDRALLYLVALVIFGSIPRDAERIRWMARGLALGLLVVCVTGLITRVLPDLWPIAPNLGISRLSYPVTYWNTLGLMASLGTILCFHFACSRSEPPLVRVIGAAAVPILVTTLYFTLSRGAILAGAIGLLAYLPLARPRALISGIVATVPPSVVAVLVSYDADRLTSEHPTTAAAVSQGEHVALVVLACVGAALLLRVLLLALDAQMDRLRPPRHIRQPLLAAAGTAALIAAIGLTAALNVPGYVSDQYDRFVQGGQASTTGSSRARLTDPGNNGRIDQWDVATDDGYEQSKFAGEGAGTFEQVWARNRPEKVSFLFVRDAHSLYVETLSDLGLAGFVFLAASLLMILYGFAARLGGRNRSLYAALLAAGLTWGLHAGVDWDWEMPAATLWFFALGGAALAAPRSGAWVNSSPPLLARAAICAALILVAIVPMRVAISQRKLDQAVQTFLQQGNCPAVLQHVDGAIDALDSRPDTYRLAGYCQARLGRMEQAIRSMAKAVDRDPDNWAYRYAMAVVRGAAGIDPRPAAREALSMDPLEPATQDLVLRFDTPDRRTWMSEGRALLSAPLF
jgi:O-antigen ligase